MFVEKVFCGGNFIQTVRNKQDLMKNFKTIDEYLSTKKDPEYNFALNLIEKGTCFIAVKVDEENYKFYQSRFIWYSENTLAKHENNFEKDGSITNSSINEILNSKPKPNPYLNSKYKIYCEQLGFIAKDKGSFGVERKFWIF